MRTSFSALALSFFLTAFSGSHAFAGDPQKDQAKIDSLCQAAQQHFNEGRFSECIAIYQDLLKKYKFPAQTRKGLAREIKAIALLDGDYQTYCLYADKDNSTKESRAFYKILAKLPAQQFVRPDHDVTIPFYTDSIFSKSGNLLGCQIKISGRIGGKEERFSLDNGTTLFNLASESFARSHGIRPVGAETKILGPAGESTTWIGIADSMSVGELTFKNILFSVVPDNARDANPIKNSVILGSSFLRLVGEMRFDNKAHTICFPARYQERPSNLSVDGSDYHFIKGTFLGDPLVFHLDLGASSSSLNATYFMEHQDDIRKKYKARSASVSGLGGSRAYTAYNVPNPEIFIGEARFAPRVLMIRTISFSDIPGTHGRLGTDFFLSFDKVVFNLQRLYLYGE